VRRGGRTRPIASVGIDPAIKGVKPGDADGVRSSRAAVRGRGNLVPRAEDRSSDLRKYVSRTTQACDAKFRGVTVVEHSHTELAVCRNYRRSSTVHPDFAVAANIQVNRSSIERDKRRVNKTQTRRLIDAQDRIPAQAHFKATSRGRQAVA
jgi:hypothetical protein